MRKLEFRPASKLQTKLAMNYQGTKNSIETYLSVTRIRVCTGEPVGGGTGCNICTIGYRLPNGWC